MKLLFGQTLKKNIIKYINTKLGSIEILNRSLVKNILQENSIKIILEIKSF